jgi:hypothetical protein
MEVGVVPLGNFCALYLTNLLYLGVFSMILMILWMLMKTGAEPRVVNSYRYTWFKYLGTSRAVEERLDRALANNDWFGLFQNAKLENLAAPASDHYPIFLECSPVVRPHPNRRNFRFENAWKFEPGFNDFFTERWTTSGNDSVVTHLNRCAGDLSDWSRTHCNKLFTVKFSKQR